MTFKLPDLIIESIIRDGLNNIRRDNSIIDDVFGDLTLPFATKKYGQAELDKIKDSINKKEISIVHSFNLTNTTIPCISIQLSDDRESAERSNMGYYVNNYEVPFTSPDQIATTVIVGAFLPTSYNPTTGIVLVPDEVNLAAVYANLVYVDASGTAHSILGGIINDVGSKQFIVEKNGDVAILAPGEIKTTIDYELYQRHGNTEEAQLILGIHTQNALMTKYLYTLVKYFIISRRHDLIARGLQLNTYTGSDFTRNLEYVGDVVYTRFLNVSGMVQHQWRADKVRLIDSVNVQVLVPKDRLGNEALNLDDASIKVKE